MATIQTLQAPRTLTQLQPLPIRPPQALPVASPLVLPVADTLQLQIRPAIKMQPPASVFKGVFDAPVQSPAKIQAQPRSQQDYQNIFNWVEKVTGKPIAYQDPKSQQAYINSIKGQKQEHYDTKGFLSKIGVSGVEAYGRDDSGVHALLKTIKYSPDSAEVSLPLRLAQKSFFWVFKTFPKTFDKVATLVDKHYFTRKDTKAESWNKMQVPMPGINPADAILPAPQVKQNYAQNHLTKYVQQGTALDTLQLFERHFKENPPAELGAMFEEDFHMGVPKDGETPQNYGTYAIAKQLGFTDQQAIHFGTANYDMDLNNTAYGESDAFPDALPSKHFNLNKQKPEGGDTRFIWAQRHLDAAVELAKRGHFDQAEREIGFGLHGIQDAFAHGHIKLASHAITDNIPDGVDYNPVGAYEATLATIGYLNEYMRQIQNI